MIGGFDIGAVDEVEIPKDARQRKESPQEGPCLANETRFRPLDTREARNAAFFEVPLQVRRRSQQ